MRNSFMIALSIFVTNFYSALHLNAYAEEKFNRDFAAETQLGEEKLLLNGRGLRVATVFKVRVYEGALYLKAKQSEAEAILNSSTPKVVEMYFVRDVGKRDLQSAWVEAFEKNASKEELKALSKDIWRYKRALKDADLRDLYRYEFMANGKTRVLRNDKEIFLVENPELSKLMLKTWLGTPPNPELKEGLLGKTS